MQYFKIAKNTLYQSFAKLFSSFIGFLITIVIARSFGTLGYGDFVKITSFVAPFYLIVDFGLNAFYLQINKESKKYSDLFWLRIFIALITFVIVNLINLLLPFNQANNIGYSPLVKIGIFIFSISILSQSVIYSSFAIFQEKIKYFYYMLSIIIGSVVNLLLVVLFAFGRSSVLTIIAAFVISGCITALFSQIFSRGKIRPINFNTQFSKKLLKTSLPLALMLIFNLVYFRIDSIILAFFKTSKDVGVYGLAYKFFDFLIALPLFLSNSLYPMLLSNQKNLRKLNRIIRNYSFVFIFLGFILIFPFWFLSPLLVLIKNDFSLSIFPFRILLLSLPIFFITSFLQWILISFRKQKYLLFVYLFSALVNVLLNLIFIPKYSYIAASYITVISECLVLVLLLIKLIPVKNMRKGIQT
jgi:O-antigen/teichoic acid export membrane protein